MNTLPLLLLALLLASPSAGSAPSAAPPATAGVERPQRLPDGSVFLPKESQRQLGIRTQIGTVQRVPLTVQLNAHVVMNPGTGGRVQASQPGRLRPGAHGLPLPGQAVRKGDVLAHIEPTPDSAARATRAAEIAEVDGLVRLARERVTRYTALEGTVPRKELDAARLELASLEQRRAALTRISLQGEVLTAPVSGVVVNAGALNGQVVAAGDVLFDIVDPTALLIEALVYDPAMAAAIEAATINGSGESLQLIGRGGVLRAGALPLLFRQKTPGTLAVGQSVTLTATLRQTAEGVVLPTAAVVRNAANESILWLHVAPERFRAVVVQVRPLDSQRVSVTGITAGQRVVTAGTTLLNQIR